MLVHAGSVLTDTISFAGKGTIPLDDQVLVQTGNALVIDGGETITISGNSSVRIFTIYAGAELTLRNLSLVDGYNGSLVGGIYNLGLLSIENSVLSRNYTGAIYNSGTLRVIDSTFSDNSASTGGGIYNSAGSALDVSNTHFLRNDAEDEGGGIFNAGQAEIRHGLLPPVDGW